MDGFALETKLHFFVRWEHEEGLALETTRLVLVRCKHEQSLALERTRCFFRRMGMLIEGAARPWDGFARSQQEAEWVSLSFMPLSCSTLLVFLFTINWRGRLYVYTLHITNSSVQHYKLP